MNQVTISRRELVEIRETIQQLKEDPLTDTDECVRILTGYIDSEEALLPVEGYLEYDAALELEGFSVG